MKFLVFGSLNIDKVYKMAHLPEKGETLSCTNYEIHVGGKGLNQSVSLSKAGADVFMAGAVGADGEELVNFLKSTGVNTENIFVTNGFSGHAVIEVDGDGQNQMILFPGANHEITEEYCDTLLEKFNEGDLVLMQYETSQVEYMMKKAHEKGLKTGFNPSPYVEKIKNVPLELVDYLVLNEFEGASLTNETEPEKISRKLLSSISENGAVILTLGGDGAIYEDKNQFVKVPAFSVDAADTTCAGDTFTGYCLKMLLDGENPKTALTTSSAASAIVVTKVGAAQTIPDKSIVMDFLNSI